ncbi:MAG TPA: hypothetical protein VF750_00130 [Sphingomicrobium sp.]
MLPKLSTSALALAIAFSQPGISATTADPDLGEVRAATARFQDVKQAEKEGYIRDPHNMCITAEMMGEPAKVGAMGIHYFRPDLLGITAPPTGRVSGNGTHTDFRKPSILIYEPQADGSLKLIAVENLVFRWAWREKGHAEPPSFRGVKYETMEDDPRTPVDEAHMFVPHYDLHVWLWRDNPSGTFAPFNPNVSCAAAKPAMAAGHDHGHTGE